MDHFDEIFEELMAEGDDDPVKAPTYRATIRGERVMLTTWAGWLATGGALGQFFGARERAGVAIADLTIEGEDGGELLVRFYSEGRSREEAERVLTEWASRVGYRRLWLSDRVVELEPDPEQIGRAEVRCPTCRAGWSDSNPEFWLFVREQGSFPRWCPLCGCELPQWTVREEEASAGQGGGRSRARTWSASDRRRSTRPTKS